MTAKEKKLLKEIDAGERMTPEMIETVNVLQRHITRLFNMLCDPDCKRDKNEIGREITQINEKKDRLLLLGE